MSDKFKIIKLKRKKREKYLAYYLVVKMVLSFFCKLWVINKCLSTESNSK